MTAHERIRQAARDGLRSWVAKEGMRFSTEAADYIANEICWQLRQKPIQLSKDQMRTLLKGVQEGDYIGLMLDEFQRRYLFSEEPEVPENIKDLVEGMSWNSSTWKSIVEAERRGFERGQRAKEQG